MPQIRHCTDYRLQSKIQGAQNIYLAECSVHFLLATVECFATYSSRTVSCCSVTSPNGRHNTERKYVVRELPVRYDVRIGGGHGKVDVVREVA